MFVQIVSGRLADSVGARKELDRWHRELQPEAIGWLGTATGTADDGRFCAVVRFASEADARRNSERPQQGEWWMAFSSHLDGDATFEESTHVQPWLPDGWQAARFLKVIRGRARDRGRLEELMTRMGEILRTDTPQVIGDIFVWLSEDRFMDLPHFTDDQGARSGIGDLSPAGKEAMDEWAALTEVLYVSEFPNLEIRTA